MVRRLRPMREEKSEFCYRAEQAFSFVATAVPVGLACGAIGSLGGPAGMAVGIGLGLWRGVVSFGRVSRSKGVVDRPWEL